MAYHRADERSRTGDLFLMGGLTAYFLIGIIPLLPVVILAGVLLTVFMAIPAGLYYLSRAVGGRWQR